MQSKDTEDSVFSSEKQKGMPWSYWLVVLGLVGLYYLAVLLSN